MSKRMTRRELLRAAAGASAGLGLGWAARPSGALGADAASAPPKKRPNILFVMVDEMRWDAMHCAGHPVVKTPTLDQLAAGGRRFLNFYSVAPVCSPARTSAFTGRYAHVHGVMGNERPANPGEVYITSILKHYGYTTAISGKLHYVPAQWDFDFDQFYSFSSEGPGKLERYPEYLKRKYGSPSVWAKKEGSCPYPDDPLGKDLGEFAYPKEDFQSFWITDRSIDFLRSQKGSDKPWFLFTSYLQPHSPYTTPEPYHSMYPPDSFDVPKLGPELAEERAKLTGKSMRHLIADETMLRAITAQYLGHVTNVDDNLERLFAEVKSLGMMDDTIVLFSADHGNMLGDRGRMFKGVMYEGSSHVPLIIRAAKNLPIAGRFNTGAPIEGIAETVDLLPTLLDMAGVPIPETGIQGKGLAPVALGEEKTWKNRAFAALATSMIRTPQYKLIDNGEGAAQRFELYDMTKDPKEQTSLAGDPQCKDVVHDLAKRLDEWRKDKPGPVVVPGLETPYYAKPLSPEEQEKLKQRAGQKRQAQSRLNAKTGGKKAAPKGNPGEDEEE
ncbi:MAG: sulfatase-like hydrolase/transferase [Candidatus Sumerlaeota bacterium]|nr:sulfatase-like hydrolase/transferase [Candidatus Sumerlaeota bacterium]